METRELVNGLRDYTRGCDMPFERYLMLTEAADKLEQLQQLVDDMLGDHYVDNLDWYSNRCRELEEELENVRSGSNGNN
jgi:hypothetical protein